MLQGVLVQFTREEAAFLLFHDCYPKLADIPRGFTFPGLAMAESLVLAQGLEDGMMELETPKKTASTEQTTPRRSERKRALFPTGSPQTSDLGHMSPLGSSPVASSPDRFSSAPASPDSSSFSPVRRPTGLVSPFGRKVSSVKASYEPSPRKQFSLLFGNALKDKLVNQDKNLKITPLVSKKNGSDCQSIKSSEKLNGIVPADQLEETVLSVMDDSDCPESPHSEHTPGTTPQNKDTFRALSDVTSAQPLTPSKRRSMPASGSGSVTSASPHSPERKRRFSLENRSRSAGAELPRARTSLFSSTNRSSGAKRVRDDGIYLTGRNSKRRKTHGEINAGVRTGIRRPPKVKPKSSASTHKRQGKVKSVWDVGPKSTTKKKSLSPIKLPKMSLLAAPVKKSDEEIASGSASASLHVRGKRAAPREEENVPESEDGMEVEATERDPNKRIFKSKQNRVATITISNNRRIKVHKGRFILDEGPPAPPAKRRRKLYSREKQLQEIKAFDDNEEDVAASTRTDVQKILHKLEDEKCSSPDADPAVPPIQNVGVAEEPATMPAPDPTAQQQEADSSVPLSPARAPSSIDGFLSPLSQLASSTSTLSINVGGETLNLTQAQVQELSAVPDVIMEDDDLPLCEPLPQEDPTEDVNGKKENENIDSESTPVKYFPIFDTTFSHKKTQLSPTVPKRKRSLLRAIGNDQYQLDAGQKRFGATECGSCSAIYQMGEPEDELAHQQFHDAVKDLKFLGWRNEHIVGQFVKGRVIAVRPGDPKAWWSKAMDVLKVVDKDLGFAEGVHCDPDHSMVYLYILDKSVVGYLLAIPVKKAHKMLETGVEIAGIDCCTSEEYPVKCGVSRIWVHRPHREKGVARQLMDCLRKNFIFGHVLSLEEIAFSSPTVLGKVFAEHYTGRKDYHVFTQS